MVSDMLLGIRWEHKFNIHTGWIKKGNHYIAHGKHNFISESINKLKMYPILKTKGKIMLKPESISIIEVPAPKDISGNRKYQLNPEVYLPQGIIPLDLVHSFEKTPRTLKLPILNMFTNYESIPRGSLLGTFEPVDEEINEIHTASWTKLEGQMHQAHAQLRRKKSYRQAMQKFSNEEMGSPELLLDYPTDSNMEMEIIMKRPEVNLEDAKDADKWKSKVMNMLK